MKNSDIIAAIDIGSARIIAALATISPTGEITLLAFAETPSKGVKKGGVTNINLAQHAIDVVLDELQVNGNCHIHSIVTSLSGVSVIGNNAEGSVSVRGSTVDEFDVRKAVAKAKDAVFEDEYRLLHILRQSFILDRQTGIDNPVGMIGDQLTARVHIIGVAKTAYYNLLQIFSHRDIDVDHVVAGGLAAVLAVSTPEERQLGVCVLDIGAGTTDISIIHNEQIKYTAVIPHGGELITSDIAFFMRCTVDVAEAIKHNIDVYSPCDSKERLEIPGLGEVARSYSKQAVANVARERCEQLIDMLMQKIHNEGVKHMFPGGFIITGGGANLTGLKQLITERTHLPARVGKVEVALPDSLRAGCRFATIMGLFQCAYEEDYTRSMTNELKAGIMGRLNTQIRSISARIMKQF